MIDIEVVCGNLALRYLNSYSPFLSREVEGPAL